MSAERLQVVVCVRPPADTPSDGGRVLGALDLRAVDYAVRLRRAGALPVRVTAVAAGGEQAVAALRECLALGVDHALHVEDDEPQVDGAVVALRLAPALADLRPDLVLCGTRSEVGMHGAVPRALAHALGLPFIGSVAELDVDLSGPAPSVRAVQRLERGDRWAWGCALPLVCAVERDLCAPRYLAVRRLHAAAAASPETRHVASASDGPADALVVEARNPPRIRPRKSTAAPSATMTAADRMKLLRGGRAPAAAGEDGDDQPRRISGDPAGAATEIIRLLERHDLL